MKKVLIIGYSPLCQKQNVILGIDKLSEKTQVEYWDISPIVGDQGRLPRISIDSVKTKDICDLNEFRESVKNLKEDVFVIFYMHLNKDTYPFFKILSDTRCYLSTVVTGLLPSSSKEKASISFFRKIFNDLKKIKKIGIYLYGRFDALFFQYKIRKLRHFDYCFYSGSIPPVTNENTHLIAINDYDYQLARSISKTRMVEGKYILFIDQYEPFHPDFDILGIEKIAPDIYFSEINAYFEKLEKRYGLPIVISAHPKADYYREKNFFCGRKIIWGCTGQLAYDADFVITHYSTAISFPVCFKKPILFIYTSEMAKKNPSICYLYSMADVLNCNKVNITESNDTDIFNVDNQKYNNYLFTYLTSPESMNTDNWQAIIDVLK